MQPPLFWQNAMLHNFAEDCVCHMLVPTSMTSKMSTWAKIEHLIDKTDKLVADVQKANMSCGICGVSQEGKQHIFAVRVLVGKRPVVGEKCWIYRMEFNSAAICNMCAYERKWPYISIDSNSGMQNIVLDTLESIAPRATVGMEDLSGAQLWDITKAEFDTHHHASVMKRMGKMDSRCNHCKRKKPKNRCSACHIVRYCNADCSKADWGKHKEECKNLQKTSIFCHDKSANIDLLLKN